jgi:putative hemolysin
MISAKLRTAMLVRELLNKRNSRSELRLGRAISAARLNEMGTDGERMEYLRWRTYLLRDRNPFKAQTRSPLKRCMPRALEPVANPIGERELRADLADLPEERRLAVSGKLHAYLAPAWEIPHVLQEIGRLREITFRAAGEGTGRSLDLDGFDAHYLHLFIWNEVKGEVVGAYRLCGTDIAATKGVAGLYTSTLFRYSTDFLRRMGPALELGRSWVRPEYQKTFGPLLLLWKGIGKFVAMHPQYKVLFGPVSISNQYQAISRHLMVRFLERYAWLEDWRHLVKTRNPFRAERDLECDGFLRTHPQIDELAEVVSDLEPGREGVPVLLRQYLKLGGKLLGFNVDREFSNALDGLIVVDLTRTEPKLLERYLGASEAARFLAFHEGN